MSAAQPVRREDYRPPAFRIDAVDLEVDIHALTTVQARLKIRRADGTPATQPLVLDGRGFDLLGLSIDGRELEAAEYKQLAESLLIARVPDAFELRVTTRLDPERNTSLEGWYRSGPMLCTQCEARGFSRITYCLDRPDVLARYRVRLTADRARFPVLLANGNCLETRDTGGGRHTALWEDPFPKPCYLFAMVAGDLARVEDAFVTASGRRVSLQFFVDHGNENRVAHAMESLKKAMRWDEQVYGLEYDLDVYMIVAARDFNMGAMENKGLNLFNARFVLASPDVATDDDYEGVESVIAHEYFHNWTGNRVTCRDWFQLSLKEGLTVFRDQCFSADQGSPDVSRIEHVRMLRAVQFPEDAGPMSHPVRPDAYTAVDNLYTATVYEKGSEILRMLHAFVGHDAFVGGVREYLKRHDGGAATVEDLLAALESRSELSLDGFRRWYSQSGTPEVEIADEYDLQTKQYRMLLKQETPPTADQGTKHSLPIPIRFGLFTPQGEALVTSAMPPHVPRPGLLLLEGSHAEVVIEGMPCKPTPSFLHGASAPVKLHYGYDGDDLVNLLLHETDGFVRWEAAQRLVLNAVRERIDGDTGRQAHMLLHGFQRLASNPPADKALLAELLRMPAESELAAQLEPLDPQRAAAARDALRVEIAHAITGPLSVWVGWAPVEPGAECRARRKLSALALWYLASTGAGSVQRIAAERATSPNMTLAIGALRAL
ncbi:MAG TPA: aminopeptidase N, partial [Nevskiaceae bacterium]|nr:aminopeptidase N [Nevskiaceae bacterium]